MFLANLNVFIPCFVLTSMFGSTFFYMFFALGLTAVGLGDAAKTGIAFALSYVAILAFLVGFWIRKGFVPTARQPDRESRYRNGHRVLAITTALLLTSVAIPLVLAAARAKPEMAMLLWFSIPVFGVAFVAWPIGLYMIWTSKA